MFRRASMLPLDRRKFGSSWSLSRLVTGSETVDSSEQNLVTVIGISLLAYPWFVSAITWSIVYLYKNVAECD